MRGSEALFWRCGVVLNPAALALARHALAASASAGSRERPAASGSGFAAREPDPAPGLDAVAGHAIMPACVAPTGCS